MFGLGNILGPTYSTRTREAIATWSQGTFPASIQDLEDMTEVEDASVLECLTDMTRESLNNNVYSSADLTVSSIPSPQSNADWVRLASREAVNRMQREQYEQQSQIYAEMDTRRETTGGLLTHVSREDDIRYDKETDDIQIFINGGWVPALTSDEARVGVKALAQTILDKLAEPELQAKEIRRSLNPNIEEDTESFNDLI